MKADVKLKCPNCQSQMEQLIEADIKFDRCPKCNGIFLDKEELNALATEMAGDIEFCSIEPDREYPDQFPTRFCPKCPDQKMKKEDLLIYSDIIFDYCEKCKGWFLDYSELESMNQWLKKLRESQGGTTEERKKHKDHLATITQMMSVHPLHLLGITLRFIPIEWSRLEVYFNKPLKTGFRLSSEKWLMKFWKLFGTEDIKTGDSEFDKTFIVQSAQGENVLTILSSEARKAILDFYRSPLFKIGEKRAFEIMDNRIVYTCLGKLSEGQREKLIDTLVNLATAIEA